MFSTWQVVGLVSISLALYDFIRARTDVTPMCVLFSIVAVVSVFHLI